MSTPKIKEYDAVAPVATDDRNLGFGDLLATWVGANANNGTWYVGGVVAGAAFAGAALVTVIANPIAYLVMALIGLIGFKVGTSTMALTRPALGIRGSYLPSVLNTIQFMGWTAVNTFIAAISVSYILKDTLGWPAFGDPGGNRSMLLGIGIMSILHLASIALGHHSVKIIERLGVVLVLILGVWETVVVLQHSSLSQILAWRPPADQALPLGKAMDVMAAFSLGWVPAIAEFTRYAKNARSAVVAPMIGANLGLFWFAFVGIIGSIGAAIRTGTYDPNNSDPSTIVSQLGLGVIALLVIIITSTTANAVNLMAAGISLTNITRRVKPIVALWLVTIASAVLTCVPLIIGNFLDSFIAFLDYIGMVFGPLCAIVIVDYFLVRRGNYRVKEMIDPSGDYAYTGGVNWRAMVVWAIGVGFFLAVRNVGVFSAWIGATYPTMILTGVLYYAQHRMNAAAKIKRGEHVA